jgi:hypothetical protein
VNENSVHRVTLNTGKSILIFAKMRRKITHHDLEAPCDASDNSVSLFHERKKKDYTERFRKL